LVYCRKYRADNARNAQHQGHITPSLDWMYSTVFVCTKFQTRNKS